MRDKVALITGGDSGSDGPAIAFAKEGADVAIVYLNEHGDARETVRLVEQCGVRAVRIAGDVGREPFCREAVRRTIRQLGRVNILVNNAAEQHRGRVCTTSRRLSSNAPSGRTSSHST